MAGLWNRRFALIASGLLGLGGIAWQHECPAQVASGPSGRAPVQPIDRALNVTLSTGRPTVVVVTSAKSEMQPLWTGMLASTQAQELIRSGQLVRLVGETNPALVRAMGVTSAPTVVVYRKGASGLEMLG